MRALPGGAGACDGWHFVEVALMDADDWRLENSEAEAVVRFTHGCSGALAAEAAALQQAAAERREQERAGAFEQIYESFGWEPSADGSKETRSGQGSYLARTNASRAFLSDVLHKFNVTTMLDPANSKRIQLNLTVFSYYKSIFIIFAVSVEYLVVTVCFRTPVTVLPCYRGLIARRVSHKFNLQNTGQVFFFLVRESDWNPPRKCPHAQSSSNTRLECQRSQSSRNASLQRQRQY